MITIYFSSFRQQMNASDYQKLLRELPLEMKVKNSRYRRWEDAHAHLFGKLLLQKGLRDFGYPDQLSQVKSGLHNRPYISDAFDFNISHSGHLAVCAFSTSGRIGIDIEKTEPIELQDFDSQWTDKELKTIKSAEDSLQQFYTYWTIKEAVMKGDGRGLGVPLKNIQIDEQEADCEGAIWKLTRIPVDREYICHLATNTDVETEQLRLVHVQFLPNGHITSSTKQIGQTKQFDRQV